MYSKLSEIIAILPSIVDEYCIGLEYGWVSPTIKYFAEPNEDLYLNEDEISWVASLHELGRTFGPFLVPLITKYYGRKKIITMMAVGHVLCWIGVLGTRSIWVLYVARFLMGFLVGFSDVVSCIYVGEVASPTVRGRYITVIYAVFICGTLSAYILGTYLTYSAHALTVLGVSVVFLASCCLLVETPQYLISTGQRELARKNLIRLRGGMETNEIQAEFESIEKSIEAGSCEKLPVWEALRNPIYVRIICLATAISVLGYLTGYASIIAYSNFIFPSNELLTSNQFTMIFGASQILAVCAASIFIEQYGRRFLLLTFAAGSVVLHSITTVLYFLHEKSIVQVPGFSWLVFATIALYSALFTFGCSSPNFVLRSELFPLQLKGIGGASTVLLQSAFIFLQTKLFMTIIHEFGIYCNFLMYAFFAFVILFVIFFYLPETKGKSLAEIQSYFHSKYGQQQLATI